MARPTWQGHLRLSLVTCPVSLYKATEAKAGFSFNLINPATNSRIKMVTHDASTGEEVDRKSLVKGYQISKDQYVLIEPEDLDALKIESTKVLDIDRFVDAASIDRIYWDEPYYLTPQGKTGIEAFAVILEAMREQEKVALARIVLSQRERIVALEARGTLLQMTTLRTHDEVRLVGQDIDEPVLPKADRSMLDIAEKIIEQRAGEFDPSEFTDRYEKAVKELIEKKSQGMTPVAPPVTEETTNVVNLMDALRKSLGAEPDRQARAPSKTADEQARRPKPAKPKAAIKTAPRGKKSRKVA
jgi:DNA end-binding protein Ku